MCEPITIYSYLRENVDDPNKTIQKIAFSVIHSQCKQIAGKDLSSHYLDMEQEIYIDWMEKHIELKDEDDKGRSIRQIVKYAQGKARYVIQSYLERMEHALTVPREESRTNYTNIIELEALEDADLAWQSRINDHVNGNASSDYYWKSVYYVHLKPRARWAIYLICLGFSVQQTATLLSTNRRKIYRLMDQVKKHAESVEV